MKRLLYQVHRWVGVCLALFMLMWFASGLVIMYSAPSALAPLQQLAFREPVLPQAGWLSLGEAWERSAEQRRQLPAPKADGPARRESTGADTGKKVAKVDADWIVDARLVRQDDQPLWLIEDARGRRYALSALSGALHETTAIEAARIAAQWATRSQAIEAGSADASLPVRHLDTGAQDSSMRNQEALRPFHRFAVGDDGRELLVSVRTGEVVRDSSRIDRAMYWAGNWIHLLRPIESFGWGDIRRDVQAWLAFFAFAGSLTGLIIGIQRWRPGLGGRPTYSQGRTQPYRELWSRWHFWAGLIGGTAALLWALSGFFNSNPLQMFSPANPSRAELNRYQGSELPAVMRDWRPGGPNGAQDLGPEIVELAWRRVGREAALLGITRRGERLVQLQSGGGSQFAESTLLDAVRRMTVTTSVQSAVLQTEYDSQYYPRHHQGRLEKPLPVLRVELADAARTWLYLDPQDGRLLSRQDQSRRVYRWAYSALHHWDFGWLYVRPVWDVWMLVIVGLGLVLATSSVVIGWKRLRLTVRSGKPAAKKTRSAESASRMPQPAGNT